MNHTAEPISEPSFGLEQTFLRPVKDRWVLLLAVPTVMVLAVLLAQATQTPTYSVRVVVNAVSQDSDNISSQLGRAGGIAALAGASLGGSVQVTEFDKFKFLLKAERLGYHQQETRNMLPRVFDKKWDADRKEWIRPVSMVQGIKDSVWPIFGMSPWLAPDGRDLARHYGKMLTVREIGETSLTEITYRDSDPKRGLEVLQAIVDDSNELLRIDAARLAEAKAGYLRQQLAMAQVAEYRINLAGLLAVEEQTLMLASTGLPYAAAPIQPYTVTAQPTSQQPIIFGLIAGVVGLGLGIFVALILGPKAVKPGAEAAHEPPEVAVS